MRPLLNALMALLLASGIARAGDAPQPGAADPATTSAHTATAIFAGGCFWCMESDFEALPGVIAAESGYTGGRTTNPDYHTVSAGGTGHAESVRVTYDTTKLDYAQLVDWFWHHVDPTVKDRQFCDAGNQYRTAIFYGNDTERRIAETSRQALIDSGRFTRIWTEIAPAGRFYPAEDYHQDYYRKNPVRYHYYRYSCGRDARVKEVWGG